MLDPATTAVITGAAGNVVAYMLNDQVDALRAWVTRIFHSETEEQRSRRFRMLEEDIAALRRQVTTEADVRARWSGLLGAYLAAYPEARADIDAISSMPVSVERANIGAQNNYGSGTFIGGDNYGTINPPNIGNF